MAPLISLKVEVNSPIKSCLPLESQSHTMHCKTKGWFFFLQDFYHSSYRQSELYEEEYIKAVCSVIKAWCNIPLVSVAHYLSLLVTTSVTANLAVFSEGSRTQRRKLWPARRSVLKVVVQPWLWLKKILRPSQMISGLQLENISEFIDLQLSEQ